MISLLVKKNTFERKLNLLGFDYKIRQYDDFIYSIRRRILSEIETAEKEDKLREALDYIFGDYKKVPFMIFYEIELISSIRKEYFIEKIEEGELDLFLKDAKIKEFTKKEQEDAFLLSFINIKRNYRRTTSRGLIDEYPFLRYAMTPYKVRLIKCIKQNKIELSFIEKEEVILNFDKVKSEILDLEMKMENGYSYGSSSSSNGNYRFVMRD